MKKILFVLVAISMLASTFAIAPKQASAGWTKGYTRSNGTYVKPYWKATPYPNNTTYYGTKPSQYKKTTPLPSSYTYYSDNLRWFWYAYN